VTTLLVATLTASTYALCIGTIAAGISGHRGVQPAKPWPNALVYGLYLLGAVGSTASGVLVLYGAVRAYFRDV
jgi:hypothetical protein